MARSGRDRFRCCNCGQFHALILGKESTNCIFIGAKFHGSGSDEDLAAARLRSQAFTTIPIPSSAAQKEILFNQVWNWFEDIKEENDELREHLARTDTKKGKLRTTAPLIWLRWRAADGRRGQTRNAANYVEIWKKLVEISDDKGGTQSVAWLTLSPLNLAPAAEPQALRSERRGFTDQSTPRTDLVKCT